MPQRSRATQTGNQRRNRERNSSGFVVAVQRLSGNKCVPHAAPETWAGPIVYLIALLGTLLLGDEGAQPWAVLLLVASAVLAVMLWGRQNWLSAFPSDPTAPTRVNGSRFIYLLGVGMAMLLVLAADLRYAAAPNETFGLAGILWIAAPAL